MAEKKRLNLEIPVLDQLLSNVQFYKDGRKLSQINSEVKESEAIMQRLLKGLEYE